MRDRLTELLPLILAGVALLVFQVAHENGISLALLARADPTPTPVIEVAGANARGKPQGSGLSAQSSRSGCNSAQPRFVGDMAKLNEALGETMGVALECERSVGAEGDTEQKTSTGLAYARKRLNLPCFTTGWDHWALTTHGVIHWASADVDPPVDAGVLTH